MHFPIKLLPRSLRQQPLSAQQCLMNLFPPSALFVHREKNEEYIRVCFRLQCASRVVEYLKALPPSTSISQSILKQFHPLDANELYQFRYEGPYCLSEAFPGCAAANDLFSEVLSHIETFLPLFRGNVDGQYFSTLQQENGAQKSLLDEIAALSQTVEMQYHTFMLIEGSLYRSTYIIGSESFEGPWRRSATAAVDAAAYLALLRVETSPSIKRSLRGYECDASVRMAQSQNPAQMPYFGLLKTKPIINEQIQPKTSISVFKDQFLIKAFLRNEFFPRMPFESAFAVQNAHTVLESFLDFRKLYLGEYTVLRFQSTPAAGGFGYISKVQLVSHQVCTFPESRVCDRKRDAEIHAAYFTICEIKKNLTQYGFYLY